MKKIDLGLGEPIKNVPEIDKGLMGKKCNPVGWPSSHPNEVVTAEVVLKFKDIPSYKGYFCRKCVDLNRWLEYGFYIDSPQQDKEEK